MTDVYISQSRPAVDTDKTIKYSLPVAGSTLQLFSHAANSLAAGRGFAHVQKTWSYEMSASIVDDVVSIENLLLDTEGLSYSYSITIPQIHPMALSVGLILKLQCHDAGTGEPSIRVRMVRLPDEASADREDGGDAILMTVSNMGLGTGGRTEDDYPDGLPGNHEGPLFPLRTIFCTSNDENAVATPTGPRALIYPSWLSEGDGVRIIIETEKVRLWSALAYEQPRLVMSK